jgi:hypothetical protein
MAHLETHHHEYQIVREYLTPWEMSKLITKVQRSGKFEIGQLSHIHLKGTDICVGYLGDESAEEVDPQRKETASQRKILKKYFRSV